MNKTFKGVITDFVRAGAIVAAVVAIFVAAAPHLNVPTSWVAYVAAAAGVINSLVGILRPYASPVAAAVLGRRK